MRHQNRKYRIGSSKDHRKSLLKNLANSLISCDKVRTTHTKCLAVRPFVEKLVTLAKTDSVFNRRRAFSKLNDRANVTKLFTEIAPKYKERAGGYLRISKLTDGRVGDNAKMSYISFV